VQYIISSLYEQMYLNMSYK